MVKFSEILKNYRDETINKIMEKYLKKNISDNNLINNDLSITSQLISQIENLNLGGEDKKLFEFINRMSDLNLNGENKKKNSDENQNSQINNENIKINLNEENVKAMESKIVNYNMHSLYYNKNSSRVNDWVNPTCLDKNFKTKLQLSFSSFKKNLDKKIYEFHFIDNVLNKEKTGSIPFQINKIEYNNPSKFINKIAYNDLICEQMADYFNILINEKLPNLKQFIKFQRHILYEIDLDYSSMLDDFYLNNKYFISEDSTPIQFNTNVPPTKRIFQNFSHFSYQISGGHLFVSDIQYDKELRKVIEYKLYNLKGENYKKILEFFSSHICDNTCKILKLANPRKKLNPINVNENFFAERYTIDINLCECCSCPIKVKEENEENKNCGFCSWKKAQSKVTSICSKCKFPFFYSTYVHNCQFINYPDKCPKCSSTF